MTDPQPPHGASTGVAQAFAALLRCYRGPINWGTWDKDGVFHGSTNYSGEAVQSVITIDPATGIPPSYINPAAMALAERQVALAEKALAEKQASPYYVWKCEVCTQPCIVLAPLDDDGVGPLICLFNAETMPRWEMV